MTTTANQDTGVILRAERESCVIDWEIKNVFSKPFNGSWLSPKFSFSGVTWHLSFRDKTYSEKMRSPPPPWNWRSHNAGDSVRVLGNETVYVYLHKDESAIPICDVSCYLGINGRSGEYTWGNVKKSNVTRNESFCRPLELNLYNFRQDFSSYGNFGYSQPTSITVFCIIIIPNKLKTDTTAQLDKPSQSDIAAQKNTCNNLSPLGRDLKELFLSGEGTDVTIKLKDKKINAHSQILTARSPVFAPMFTCDMKEKNTGEVDIKEFEPEAFREFIIFLYCGETENMSRSNVIDLYCAADKYDVKELKTKCRNFMKEDMSVDSFCDVLSLAIKYTDAELISHSKAFFIKNVRKILATVEWITFAKQYPTESNALFLSVVNKFVPEEK